MNMVSTKSMIGSFMMVVLLYNILLFYTPNVYADPETSYRILEYKFPWPPYGLTAPWRSAMAQAVAIQVLIKANQITGESKYLQAGKELLNSLFLDVKNGGATYKSVNEGWWFELFAGSGNRGQPRVLNGMLVTLLGIYDYYNYTKDQEAKYLFDKGIQSLKKNIAKYDINQTYTYYDLCCGNISPLPYHKLVVDSLYRLYKITNDDLFKSYYYIWSNYTIPSVLLKTKPAPQPHLLFDDKSVPILDYGHVMGIFIGLQRNPLTIGNYAMKDYESYLHTGDIKLKTNFLNKANWLVTNSERFSQVEQK